MSQLPPSPTPERGRGGAMACSLCRATEHNYTRCPKRPGSTVQMDVSADAAEVVMRETLRPIIRASIFAPNLLETVALSAYLQGALDGRSEDLTAALAEAERGDATG